MPVTKKPKTHRKPLSAKTQVNGCYITLPEQMPALDALFAGLGRGEGPDFLQFMSAIQEMVAFYTNSDQNSDQLTNQEFFMSQNKCRFCG